MQPFPPQPFLHYRTPALIPYSITFDMPFVESPDEQMLQYVYLYLKAVFGEDFQLDALTKSNRLVHVKATYPFPSLSYARERSRELAIALRDACLAALQMPPSQGRDYPVFEFYMSPTEEPLASPIQWDYHTIRQSLAAAA